MSAASQIVKASVLGTIAFKDGKKRVPALSGELMSMLAGRQVGVTPEGEASTVSILKAFAHSWDCANLAA